MTENSAQLIGIKELFNSSWQTFAARWKTVLAISLVGVVVGLMAAVVLIPAVVVNLGLFFVLLGVVVLIGLPFSALLLAAQTAAVEPDSSLGYKQAIVSAKPLVWSMLGALVLSGLAVLAGLVLLIIPGIVVAVWLSLTNYVLVFEKTSATGALKRSRQLIKGYAWPVFGRLLLLGAIALGFSIITSIIFPTEQVPVTGSMNWDDIMSTSRELHRNPLGELIDTVFSIGFSIYSLAFGYHIYKNLVNIKGGAEQVASES